MKVKQFCPGVVAVLLLSVLTASACLATEHVLVRDGRSTFSLYRGEDAPSSVKLAAEEIQVYVSKATDAELHIRHAADMDAPSRNEKRGAEDADTDLLRIFSGTGRSKASIAAKAAACFSSDSSRPKSIR